MIFHDGDDDNAICVVMQMRVPGVTGRLCEETQHWCYHAGFEPYYA